jgi:hypothetical protein
MTKDVLDLVDEMNWEDCSKVEKITLEEAKLEERLSCVLNSNLSNTLCY